VTGYRELALMGGVEVVMGRGQRGILFPVGEAGSVSDEFRIEFFCFKLCSSNVLLEYVAVPSLHHMATLSCLAESYDLVTPLLPSTNFTCQHKQTSAPILHD